MSPQKKKKNPALRIREALSSSHPPFPWAKTAHMVMVGVILSHADDDDVLGMGSNRMAGVWVSNTPGQPCQPWAARSQLLHDRELTRPLIHTTAFPGQLQQPNLYSTKTLHLKGRLKVT